MSSAVNTLYCVSFPRCRCLAPSVVELYIAAPIFPFIPDPSVYIFEIVGSVRRCISQCLSLASSFDLSILISTFGVHHGGRIYGYATSDVAFCPACQAPRGYDVNGCCETCGLVINK